MDRELRDVRAESRPAVWDSWLPAAAKYSREPRAESREPRAGAESREPRAESREPRAESREPRAESREPSREPRAESREPRAESREPRAESREPRAESRELRLGARRRATSRSDTRSTRAAAPGARHPYAPREPDHPYGASRLAVRGGAAARSRPGPSTPCLAHALRTLAVLFVAAAALLAGHTARAQGTELWSGTLTVGTHTFSPTSATQRQNGRKRLIIGRRAS